MRTVALAGEMGSGKSAVAGHLRAAHGFQIRGFGDVVRAQARARGIPSDDRIALQDLGQELVETLGAAWMVERVSQPPSSKLVIDGVRHVNVLDALVEGHPDLVFVFLSADPESLDRRWHGRGDTGERAVAAAHPVEAELAALYERASLVIRTEDFAPAQVAEVIAAAARSHVEVTHDLGNQLGEGG